ncbi:MAG: hypothetical protein CVV10_07470 [Gammaproteobacteria bacterium HGW-Gammaproteobacteria-14]|nr:MAG: hypothetical protein CVV10_07470 [Gammaproteobacteria bacterium HGW-Gammaproteobacteria-14]
MLVGSSLSGKTTILNEFFKRHPADDNLDGEAVRVPVLYVSLPESPKDSIYYQILGRLGVQLPSYTKFHVIRETALKLMCERGTQRVAFGKPLVNLGGNRERIAEARIMIEQARLLVLKAAWLIDTRGVMAAMSEISQIKVVCPNVAQQVIDMAIQMHGGGGMSNDFPLAAAWTMARALRLADGPDEVHRGLIAKFELMKYKG